MAFRMAFLAGPGRSAWRVGIFWGRGPQKVLMSKHTLCEECAATPIS